MNRFSGVFVFFLPACAAWSGTHSMEGHKKIFNSSGSTQFPSPQYYEVDQDHFDGTNLNTWHQAYYVNDTYWKGPTSNAPVFLCVGGEGPPIDGSAVVSSVHCNVAVEWLQETGALMFALEHRYYGCHNMSACPVPSFVPKDSLRFLSSRQALGDIAAFHSYATKEFHLSPGNKWVTWGGSYPGMLAGWARLKFPNLIHAAVSSSAPVRAELDMRGYNDVVAYAFTVSDNNVGGSPACSASIAKGHRDIGEMMNTTSGRATLADLFPKQVPSATWLEERKNQRSFAGEGVAEFPAQSNDPACKDPACNIALICKIMLDTSIGDEVNRLAAVARAQGIEAAQNQSSGVKEIPDFWGYQTCTEFAFYQTCEVGSGCFFTQGLDGVEDEDSFCHSLYQIPDSKIQRNVNYTNAYYGADMPAGSRVLYPNGEVDPWRSLGIVNSSSTDLPTLWVPGASHHAWTHPSSSSDQPSVIAARQAIRNQVAKWLQE